MRRPGTLDGGDICEAEERFFLGLSQRTNEEGARQLAAHLAREGYTSAVIDVRGMSSILHLKSGISYIGDNTLVVMEEMAGHELFKGYELIRVASRRAMRPTAFGSMNGCWWQPGIRGLRRSSRRVGSIHWNSRCQSFKRWMAGSVVFPCGFRPRSTR